MCGLTGIADYAPMRAASQTANLAELNQRRTAYCRTMLIVV